MYLLNAKTYELVERFELSEGENPDYAILSHTWGKASDEVSFKDIQSEHLALAKNKPGFAKLQFAAQQAVRDGLPYVWVDTCCIDKSSSAELSESINSMFRWYQKAKVCYAYLPDVMIGHCFEQHFRDSRWFTRAWTLQELIAPADVRFFDRDCAYIGTRTDLVDKISVITSIDSGLLLYEKALGEYSIAQRMSWAARRTATRSEDIAYSLLGIFNVNMSMLYGEGTKAFVRLQEEIIKSSTDQSIFAWDTRNPQLVPLLLAPSPRVFESAGDIVCIPGAGHRSYYLTNSGLDIDLDLVQGAGSKTSGILNCQDEVDGKAIALRLNIAYTTAGTQSVGTRTHNSYFVYQPGYIHGNRRETNEMRALNNFIPVKAQSTVGRLRRLKVDGGSLDSALCRLSILRGNRPEDVSAALAVRQLPQRVILRLPTSIGVVDAYPKRKWNRTPGQFRFADSAESLGGAVQLNFVTTGQEPLLTRTVIAFGARRVGRISTSKWVHTDQYHQDDGLSHIYDVWKERFSQEKFVLGAQGAINPLTIRDRSYTVSFQTTLIHGEAVGVISVRGMEEI